jgi:hypothetical protein
MAGKGSVRWEASSSVDGVLGSGRGGGGGSFFSGRASGLSTGMVVTTFNSGSANTGTDVPSEERAVGAGGGGGGAVVTRSLSSGAGMNASPRELATRSAVFGICCGRERGVAGAAASATRLTAMTFEQTVHRARTPPSGTRSGSMRYTVSHDWQRTFMVAVC